MFLKGINDILLKICIETFWLVRSSVAIEEGFEDFNINNILIFLRGIEQKMYRKFWSLKLVLNGPPKGLGVSEDSHSTYLLT